MENRKAAVTGANGQTGSYLCEHLLERGYRVFGIVRRSSTDTTERLTNILNNPDFELITCDITDGPGITNIIRTTKCHELYNLAAQSHVGISFTAAHSTFEVTGAAIIHQLEAIKQFSPNTHFLQASSSEIFGTNGIETGQNEDTSFAPQSPYAAAKTFSEHMVKIYRQAYKLHISSTIAFNHESPRRGLEFVTRKVTNYIGKLKNGLINEPLKLGNLNAYRDWSHAKDVAAAMHLVTQYKTADTYVVSSGETYSVEHFVRLAFKLVDLDWKEHVVIDKNLFRPLEVPFLKGDSTKIRTLLGWRPNYSFLELCQEMIDSDIQKYGKKTSKTSQTSPVFQI